MIDGLNLTRWQSSLSLFDTCFSLKDILLKTDSLETTHV
jgi:hypothetical protein